MKEVKLFLPQKDQSDNADRQESFEYGIDCYSAVIIELIRRELRVKYCVVCALQEYIFSSCCTQLYKNIDGVMATYRIGDKAAIQKQLVLARETLAKLRTLSDTNDEVVNENGSYSSQRSDFQNGYFTPRDFSTGNSGTPFVVSRNAADRFESRTFENHTERLDYTKTARDNLVKKLGLQVSKLEDDLKVSLVSYLEEVELQKEDLINSFDKMQQQVLQHQKSCHDHHKQSVEKEIIIQKLRASKQALEKENQRLKRETTGYVSNSPLPFSEESYPENLSSISSSPRSFHSHLQNGNSDLQESLIEENTRLRELLHQCDNNEVSRLEHKVGQHAKLSDAYTKELCSKEGLIKQLKAENRGLQADVESLENEMLRVNASRLRAEQQKDKLHQELQFSDEQINTLRLKLKTTAEEKQYLKEAMEETKERANTCEKNLVTLEQELMDLRNRSENTRNKIREKENCINSLKHDNHNLGKTCDSLRKELSIAKNEAYDLRCDRDRLQKESTDKEIEFMNSETTSKANQNKLQELKQNLHVAETKLANLEGKCQKYERKEAKLNQEALANLEKYTQAEQELFLTKREQAQLRGFYDSSENKRNRLQADLEAARQQIKVLENDIQNTRNNYNKEPVRQEVDRLRKVNQELEDELEHLQGVVSCNSGTSEQLEKELSEAKEQVGVQSMRADSAEELLKRKDKKIKQLRDELVEVHNQNDALTDQLLKKSRDTESLKISTMLLEQELESLKARAKSQSRNPLPCDQAAFGHGEPATSDSGISETDCSFKVNDRNKQVRHEAQEQDPSNVDSLAQAERRETSRKLKELEKENEVLKDEERKVKETVAVFELKLNELAKENEQLKMKEMGNNKQQSLQDELIEIIPDYQENGFGELLATPEPHSFSEEDFMPGRASSRIDIENEELRAQNEVLNQSTRELEEKLKKENENVNDLLSQREQMLEELKRAKREVEEISKLLTDAEEEKNRFKYKNEQLEVEVTDLRETIETREASIWKIQEEREALSEELRQTKEDLDQLEQLQTNEQVKYKEVHENLMNEILVKEQDIASLQHELSSVSDKCETMESSLKEIDDSKDTNAERELFEVKSKCAELESELESCHNRELEYNQILAVADDKIRTLTAEVEDAKTEQEEAQWKLHELQQEVSLAETELHKLNDKTMAMRKDAERDQEKQAEDEKVITNLENEKRQLTDKLLEAEERIGNLEKLCDDVEGRKEIAVETMRESLHTKDKDIADLTSELSLAELKYTELRSMIETSEEKSSGIHQDLLNMKEKLVEMENENDNLLQQEKSFKEALTEKDEQLKNLNRDVEELEKGMHEREDEFNDVCRRVEELEILNENLREENELLLHAARESDEKLTDAVRNLQELDEEKKTAEQELKVTHESITDLETAFEESQDEKCEFKRKLENANEKIHELNDQNNQLLEEMKTFEERNAQQEADFATIEELLQNQKDRVDELQIELNTAESKLSLLEEAKGRSQNQEQLLQEKALNALQSLNEIEIENTRLKSQQSELEKALAREKQKQTDLEGNNDNLKKINEDISKDLETERENVWAIQDELDSKQKELKRVQKELQRHKVELEEAETIQTQEMYKKSKLKEELLQANKQIEELEVDKEIRKRDNEHLEKQLNVTKEKVASFENKLEQVSKENADLKGQYDELKKRLKLSVDEANDLEKMLQQQKELCEDYRKTLVERDETILNLNFSRDAAEGALQSVKSDLVNKESVYKGKKDQIDRLQYELNRTQKKLDKTEVFYEKNCLENERLQKEVSDLKKRIGELEEVRVERELLANQLDKYKKLYNMQATAPLRSAEEKVKDWDDKLERAQSRVSDTLTELTKDIRRQEQKSFRSGTPTRKKQFQFEEIEESDVLRTKSYSRDNSVDSMVSDSSDLLEIKEKKNYKQSENESSQERQEDGLVTSTDPTDVGKQKNKQEETSIKSIDESAAKEVQFLQPEPAIEVFNSNDMGLLYSATASFEDKQMEVGNHDNCNDVCVGPPPGFETPNNQPITDARPLNTDTASPDSQSQSPDKDFLGSGENSSNLNVGTRGEPTRAIELPPDDFAQYFVPSKPNPSSTDARDHTETAASVSPSESDMLFDLMPSERPDGDYFSYDVTNPSRGLNEVKGQSKSRASQSLPESDLLLDFMPTKMADVTDQNLIFTDVKNHKEPTGPESDLLLDFLPDELPDDSQQSPSKSECADNETGVDSLASTLVDFGFSASDGHSSVMSDPFITSPKPTPTPSWTDGEDFDTPRTVKAQEINDHINFDSEKEKTNKYLEELPNAGNQNEPVKILLNDKIYREEPEDVESSVDALDDLKEGLQRSPIRHGPFEEPSLQGQDVESVFSPQREATVTPEVTGFPFNSDNKKEEKGETNDEPVAPKQEELTEAQQIPFQAVTIGIDTQKKTATKVPANKTHYSPELPRRGHVVKEFEKTTEHEPSDNTPNIRTERNSHIAPPERDISPRRLGKLTTLKLENLLDDSGDQNIASTDKDSEKELRKAVEDQEHCRKPSKILKEFEKRGNVREKPEIRKPKPPPKPAKNRATVTMDFEKEDTVHHLQGLNKQVKEKEQSLGEKYQTPRPAPRAKPRKFQTGPVKGKEKVDTAPGVSAKRLSEPRYKPIKVEIEIDQTADDAPDEVHCRKPSEIVKEIEGRARASQRVPHPRKQDPDPEASAVKSTSGGEQNDPGPQGAATDADDDAENIDKGRKRVLKLIAAFEGKEV